MEKERRKIFGDGKWSNLGRDAGGGLRLSKKSDSAVPWPFQAIYQRKQVLLIA